MTQARFPYASNSNRFLACEPLAAQAFAIVGIPADGAVTNRPGARFGPQSIRAASLLLCDGIHPHFDVSPTAWLGDGHDLRLPNASPLPEVQRCIQTAAAPLLAAHHCVFLGGDHSITLPLLRAAAAQYGTSLALLHFDAHSDASADHFGEPAGHGTWVYEAMNEGLISGAHCVQIGVRSSGARASRQFVSDHGGEVLTGRSLRGLEGAALGPAIEGIRRRIGARPIYLTLDIDCLDPAYAPGTGTPEAGGLTSTQVLTFIEELADLNWIAMDCVEVAPAYDHAEITSLAAATFVWTYLAGQVARR